jgi:hypothetical protein
MTNRNRFTGTPILLGLAAALVFSMAALLPSETRGQDGQGKYLTEASARLGKLIARANQDGFKFYDDTFSVGGGWLQQSQTKWVNLYTVTLTAGKRYRLMAAGDFDAKDVDLDVQDLNGKTYAKDEEAASEAVVNFMPPTTQKYLVRVRLYDSNQNAPCMCLAIVMVQK